MRVLITLAVMVSIFMMVGCGSSGGDSGPAAATVADLENQVFTFMDGAAFGLEGQAVTLRFGDFDNDGDGNANTGPVTLDVSAPNGMASGTATVSSLELEFADSEGIADLPPATVLSFEATINDDRTLNLTNMASGATSVSDAPQSIPTNQVAFVLTGDFASPLGSYSVVDLDTRAVFTDIVPAGIDSDALPARLFNGRIYVVNRTQSNIQIIDPQQGYTTPIGAQLSVGENPHDIAFTSPEKAYVSRYEDNKLWIINPTTLTVPENHEIDLSGLVQEGDPDGNPEMDFMLVHDGKLYVTLQHLDTSNFFLPVAAGEVVVIDTATDMIEAVIPLHASNPFSELQFTDQLERGPRILVSTVGNFGDLDGGIVAIDPETQMVDPGFVISEMAIGGEITHFEIVSDTLGFAIISFFQGETFLSSLVSFDLQTGEQTTLFGPVDFFIPHFAINDRNELYLVTQGVPAGIEIFDVTQGARVTTEPLNVGAAPPTYVLFVEP